MKMQWPACLQNARFRYCVNLVVDFCFQNMRKTSRVVKFHKEGISWSCIFQILVCNSRTGAHCSHLPHDLITQWCTHRPTWGCRVVLGSPTSPEPCVWEMQWNTELLSSSFFALVIQQTQSIAIFIGKVIENMYIWQ